MANTRVFVKGGENKADQLFPDGPRQDRAITHCLDRQENMVAEWGGLVW